MSNALKIYCFILGCLISFGAQAKLYKWVDHQGLTHYGETIPPEYADRDRSEISKTGRIVNKQDVLTPEERQAQKRADEKKKADLVIERSQKLHDNSLLNTYTSSDEIDSAKSRNIGQVEAHAQIATKQLADANASLADLQVLAKAKIQSGKPVPPYLSEEIDVAQAKVDKINKEVVGINAEKAALEARYDADKARYKELTGK
jgi:hypothetical protein